PADRRGDPYYIQAGRTKLFKEEDIDRLLKDVPSGPRPISQFIKDAHDRLPIGMKFAEQMGLVYFVETGDFIKIGHTKNWRVRLTSLQTSSPTKLTILHLEPGDVSQEKALHRKFRHLHNHGEWFRKGADLIAYIDRLKETRQGAD